MILGVAAPFAPAPKAHPALLVRDLDGPEGRLSAAGHACVRSDGEFEGVQRGAGGSPAPRVFVAGNENTATSRPVASGGSVAGNGTWLRARRNRARFRCHEPLLVAGNENLQVGRPMSSRGTGAAGV
ncbi:hypothetical protein CLV56_0053 [Mumia flava]|uniref:Uncharacterized protein n=1 Tax=Mumia flava TaxID=1348852 RepID=A0A2M9BD63_9ACTN|nr:hypothetical protein [Mumia flava]PJJ55854.1 hypothetical protein CLV56_0053 [Mumia flava]